jgi:predicted RNA-binding protein with PIN domain
MDGLPAEVRARVLSIAADHLGAMPAERVPAGLQQVRRFTPAKRARTGAVQLSKALADDALFRQGVVERARGLTPQTPVEAAAQAYLVKADGWEDLVAQVGQELDAQRESQQGQATVDAVQRLTEQLEALRSTGRAELSGLQAELKEASAELSAQRKKVREMGDRAGRAEAAQRVAEGARDAALAELAALQASRAAELRVLQDQVADAERSLGQARAQAREGQKDDQLRLRLLLDALVGAAQGLRRELALPPAEGRPADALVGDYATTGRQAPQQGRSADDPALLEALLAVPTTHLLVDGYNVTKTAYPNLSLEQQRARLLASLGSLAARTSVELTVVFDGSDGAVPVALPSPRGVRLLFSRTGETADEVLRRLAAHEPQGRPVVVVSSDKEIIEGVRRTGARPVPSMALARLLERGTVGSGGGTVGGSA